MLKFTDNLPSHHKSEELRAARLGWNALLNLSKDSSVSSNARRVIEKVMAEMNRTGMFDKPGEVKQGPIRGDDP